MFVDKLADRFADIGWGPAADRLVKQAADRLVKKAADRLVKLAEYRLATEYQLELLLWVLLQFVESQLALVVGVVGKQVLQ